jgi:hypothetical protein
MFWRSTPCCKIIVRTEIVFSTLKFLFKSLDYFKIEYIATLVCMKILYNTLAASKLSKFIIKLTLSLEQIYCIETKSKPERLVF